VSSTGFVRYGRNALSDVRRTTIDFRLQPPEAFRMPHHPAFPRVCRPHQGGDLHVVKISVHHKCSCETFVRFISFSLFPLFCSVIYYLRSSSSTLFSWLPLASFGMYVCFVFFRLRRDYPTVLLNFNKFVCYSFFFSRFSQRQARGRDRDIVDVLGCSDMK